MHPREGDEVNNNDPIAQDFASNTSYFHYIFVSLTQKIFF